MMKQPAMNRSQQTLQTHDHITKMAHVRAIKRQLQIVCVLTRVFKEIKEQQKYQKTIQAFLNIRIFGSKDLQ